MIFTLLFPACGKKDDPMPPQATVAHPAATSGREGVLLVWSLNGVSEGVNAFKFVRSEIVPGSPVCLGCPQVYRPYVTVAIADEHLRREGDKGFQYLDTDVKVGSYYFYRISACDRAGHCGDASNEASVRHNAP
jgi:hypothetical protein